MTIKAQTVTIGLGVLALLMCCDESKAQEPKRFDKGPSYLDRPAVSPYLNLLRRDNAVLTPYHTFVKPQQDAARQQLRQWGAIRQLQGWSRRTESRTQTMSTATGGGGSFQNYSHFYRFGGGRK